MDPHEERFTLFLLFKLLESFSSAASTAFSVSLTVNPVFNFAPLLSSESDDDRVGDFKQNAAFGKPQRNLVLVVDLLR